GSNGGGLTPSQRADVASFAQAGRKESGSGISIEIPKGGPTDHAAADAVREIRSILAAVGVPANAIYVRNYRPPKTSLASIRLNYTKLIAEAGPRGGSARELRPTCGSGNAANPPHSNRRCPTPPH